MRGNEGGGRKKGGRVRSKETEKNEDVWGRSALEDTAFQGTLNDFILLLHLYSSTFQETEDDISKSAFLSLTIKWDIN